MKKFLILLFSATLLLFSATLLLSACSSDSSSEDTANKIEKDTTNQEYDGVRFDFSPFYNAEEYDTVKYFYDESITTLDDSVLNYLEKEYPSGEHVYKFSSKGTSYTSLTELRNSSETLNGRDNDILIYNLDGTDLVGDSTFDVKLVQNSDREREIKSYFDDKYIELYVSEYNHKYKTSDLEEFNSEVIQTWVDCFGKPDYIHSTYDADSDIKDRFVQYLVVWQFEDGTQVEAYFNNQNNSAEFNHLSWEYMDAETDKDLEKTINGLHMHELEY